MGAGLQRVTPTEDLHIDSAVLEQIAEYAASSDADAEMEAQLPLEHVAQEDMQGNFELTSFRGAVMTWQWGSYVELWGHRGHFALRNGSLVRLKCLNKYEFGFN